MKPILERLRAGEILVCDGAMGTFLQAKGLQPGECPELWCVEKPDEVKDVHRQYREAGSDIVECNSFGCTSYKLTHYGLEKRAFEMARAAAAIAREVAGTTQYVLGSAGPTGSFMEPYGDETEESIYAAYKEQMLGFEAGGADAVVVETMTAAEEAAVAVKAAKENTKLTVIASLTFDPKHGGGYATMMGVTPERAAEEMLAAGADIVGTNCGTGIDHMIEIIRAMRKAAPKALLLAMPNAGMPVIEDGKTVFKETPEQMASKAKLLVQAGASIVGGCCGTSPAHIKAIKQTLKG